MNLNPFRIAKSVIERIEELRFSRPTGTASRVKSTVVSRLRTLEDYLPAKLRRGEKDGAPQFLSPAELAKVYSQLPAHEKDAISEQVKVAASDALTTLEGFVPQGNDLTHRAVGRLLFEADGPDGKPLPMHNVLVELWDRDVGPDDILSRTSTDRQGRFELWYDPADAGKFDRPDLELRIYEVYHFYKKHTLHLSQKLIYSIRGDDNVTKQTYDFGDCRVPYWEYDPSKQTPRLLVVENSAAPQSFSPGRALKMALELAPLQIKKFVHHAQKPSIQEIQNDYPENLTILLEQGKLPEGGGREFEQYLHNTRGDEFFGERILNGMTASILDRDPNESRNARKKRDRFWIHHHWTSYEHDSEHAAPNVDIFLEVEQGQLVPVEIKLQFRTPGDSGEKPELEPPISYTPDSDQWPQAKRVARVSAALHAELDVHLAQTHLNVEQYAIAVYRNLRKSPVRLMLMPHLKEVAAINQEADRWLLGDAGFISRSQALTGNAIDQRLRQVLGTLDWKHWKPRKRICAGHTYAQAAQLFWDTLTQYVDRFFTENDVRIKKHWYEIHRFSQDLVEHSVPFYMCPYLRRELFDGSGKLRDDAIWNEPSGNGWYEANERIDLRSHSMEEGAKAISPVTTTDAFTHPAELENLKQVCRYVIFHATFFHHWPNSKQYDDGGEIVYGGLGLRNGDNGVMRGEDDLSIAPPPERATEQLWFASVLTRTKFGHILTNEDHDIPPGLPDALRTKEVAFQKLGVDVHQLPSRLNI